MRAKRAALREMPRIPSPHSFSALWHDTSMGWYTVQVHWCISPVSSIHHYHSAKAKTTGGITGYFCNNTISWSRCLLTHRTQCICRCRWRCPWLLWHNTRSRWTWATSTGSYPRKTKPCRIQKSYVWFGNFFHRNCAKCWFYKYYGAYVMKTITFYAMVSMKLKFCLATGSQLTPDTWTPLKLLHK